jgi:hypothetical protein
MRRTLWTVLAAGLLAVGAASCGGGGDTAGDLCNKMNTCNDLAGMSVAECKDALNQTLKSLTSSQKADAEKMINQCVGLADCTNFSACISSLTGH